MSLSDVFHSSFFQIWRYVCLRFTEEFYLRELCKGATTNPKTALRWIQSAKKIKLIFPSRKAGKTMYYRLNLEDQRVSKLVEFFMAEKAQSTYERHRFLVELVKDLRSNLGDDMEAAILYGSLARATETKVSDVDILIVLRDTSGANAALEVCHSVGARYSKRIEPMTVSLFEFTGMLKERTDFAKNLVRENVVLYGYEIFLGKRKEAGI